MVRGIIVTLIALFLVVGGTVETIFVNNFTKSLEDNMAYINTQLETEQEDITYLAERVKKTKDNWVKGEKHLSLIFNYKDLRVISESLSNLHSAIVLNDYQSAFTELGLINIFIERNEGVMSTNFQSIF